MHSAIAQFLRYLSVEKNASQLTIKSYREDLIDLADYLIEQLGRQVRPQDVTPRDLRGYVAALHEAGYARTSISRKLASLRSFYRFAQRQQWCESESCQAPAQSAGHAQVAALLDRRRSWKVVAGTTHSGRTGVARPGHPGDHVLRRLARQRSGGAG